MALTRVVPPFMPPLGTAPGVDRHHLAAGSGLRYSGIAASGGNFINLLDGSQGTRNTNPSTKQTPFGPGVLCDVNGWVSGVTNWADAGVGHTYAAIFDITASAVTGTIFSTRNTNTGGFSKIQLPSLVLLWNTGGLSFSSGLPALVVGHTYFVAASFRTANQNWVYVDLTTGQTFFTANTTAGAAPSADNSGSFAIGGEFAGSRSLGGRMIAVMFNGLLYMRLQQLLAWAEDPWGFWYPQQEYVSPDSLIVGRSAAPPVTAQLMGQICMW